MAITKQINMVKGDSLVFGMEFSGLDTLDSASFTCRTDWEETVVFQKTIGSGITKVSDGVYRVRVAPADTEDVDGGEYVYDLKIEANNDVYTIMRGLLIIER